jgi:hypothetical protein
MTIRFAVALLAVCAAGGAAVVAILLVQSALS